MKLRKLTALLLTAVVGITSISSVFAETNNISESGENEQIMPLDVVLFEDTRISSSNGAYRSVTFAAPNTNNVNMYFNNTGSETAYVKLYKESTNKQVGSTLKVTAGNGTHIQISGITKTNYYVKITNDKGSTITGHLRLRQL